MTRIASSELEALRGKLAAELQAELWAPAIDSEKVCRLSRAISATNLLRDASDVTETRRSWLLPVVIAGIALLCVGASSLIHLGSAQVELVATASEFRFRVAETSQALIGSLELVSGSFVPVGAKVDGVSDGYAGFSALKSVQALGGSEFNLTNVSPGCFELRLLSGQLRALALQEGAADGQATPWPQTIDLTGTGSLNFCVSKDTMIIADGVGELLVATELRTVAPPALFIPSLLKGELTVASTAKNVALKNTDRLSIGEIENGSMAIHLQKSMEVSLSGVARRPMLFGLSGPRLGSGTDLRPTLLEFATSSPRLKAMIASIVGLAGAIMGILHWFGISRKN